jgi:hypothetical protein
VLKGWQRAAVDSELAISQVASPRSGPEGDPLRFLADGGRPGHRDIYRRNGVSITDPGSDALYRASTAIRRVSHFPARKRARWSRASAEMREERGIALSACN